MANVDKDSLLAAQRKENQELREQVAFLNSKVESLENFNRYLCRQLTESKNTIAEYLQRNGLLEGQPRSAMKRLRFEDHRQDSGVVVPSVVVMPSTSQPTHMPAGSSGPRQLKAFERRQKYGHYCAFCGAEKEHGTKECPLSDDEKLRMIKEQGMCTNCLATHHDNVPACESKCKSTFRCRRCNAGENGKCGEVQYHHTAIHDLWKKGKVANHSVPKR